MSDCAERTLRDRNRFLKYLSWHISCPFISVIFWAKCSYLKNKAGNARLIYLILLLRPFSMEKLAPRSVDTFVSMSAEIVALCLGEILWQAIAPIAVKII
jgi:hypothetical protein